MQARANIAAQGLFERISGRCLLGCRHLLEVMISQAMARAALEVQPGDRA